MQHTKETVPDQLSKITYDNGETYILHVEWQSEDDPVMDNRMLTRKLGKEFKIAMGTISKFKVEKYPFYQLLLMLVTISTVFAQKKISGRTRKD